LKADSEGEGAKDEALDEDGLLIFRPPKPVPSVHLIQGLTFRVCSPRYDEEEKED
jgi:hypothetical protein